jgi:hypothetical protein
MWTHPEIESLKSTRREIKSMDALAVMVPTARHAEQVREIALPNVCRWPTTAIRDVTIGVQPATTATSVRQEVDARPHVVLGRRPPVAQEDRVDQSTGLPLSEEHKQNACE